MKKFYLSVFLMAASFMGLTAQTVPVTFQVDMANVGPNDTVSVAGSFQVAGGFASDWMPGITLLTDADNDSIYDITVMLPSDSTYQYKFVNGASWGLDEGVPSACNSGGNRFFTVGQSAMTLPPVCFAMCDTCPTNIDSFEVTFRVDMSQAGTMPGDTVSVAGSFQGEAGYTDWTPGVTQLTDGNADDVYELTVTLPEGEYQYKYINGTAWGQDEAIPCGCAVNNNRQVIVDQDLILDIVCFGSCNAICNTPLPNIDVTFRVDLQDVIVNSSGVYVAGSFQNPAWVKDTLEMLDPDGDRIYEYTGSIPSGVEYHFKYFNGDGGDPNGESADLTSMGCGCDNGIGGHNRVMSLAGLTADTTLPAYLFDKCEERPYTPGIASSDRNPYFIAFPNPATQLINVTIDEQFNATVLTVHDVAGKEVMRETAENKRNLQIPVEHLVPGLYIIKMESDLNGQAVQRISIQ